MKKSTHDALQTACRRALFLCCLALVLSSCGYFNRPNDTAALEALGINKPIVISAALNRVFDTQGKYLGKTWVSQDSGPYAALFFKVGYIDVVPTPESAPYWRFQPTQGQINATDLFGNQNYLVVVAHRKILERSNTKTWTEGSLEYFAETITYQYEFESKFSQAMGLDAMGPFTLRLVMVNDPAVGHWQLSLGRGTEFDESQALSQLEERVKVAGKAAKPALLAKIVSIQNKRAEDENAQNQKIADQFSQDGALTRDKDNPNVLISKRSGLAFFVGDIGAPPTSISEAQSYCARVNVQGYAGWHIPKRNDLAAVVQNNKWMDAPDGRVWGDIARIPQNMGSLLFLTDTLFVERPHDPSSRTLVPIDAPVLPDSEFIHVALQVWEMKRDQSMAFGQVDVGNSMTGFIVRQAAMTAGVPANLRVICTTLAK